MDGTCDFTLLQGGLSQSQTTAGDTFLSGSLLGRDRIFDLILIGVIIIILMIGFRD